MNDDYIVSKKQQLRVRFSDKRVAATGGKFREHVGAQKTTLIRQNIGRRRVVKAPMRSCNINAVVAGR